MAWIIQLLPFLIFAFVVISVIRNVAKLAKRIAEEQAKRAPANFDPAEAERTRRVQEEIRRKIAERRGASVTRAPEPELAPPVLAPREERPEPSPEPAAVATTAAVLERQQQLANQMKALEAARQLEQRKAAAVAAAQEAEAQAAAAVVAARGNLLADLRNPPTMRRAVLMNEILGRPLSLR